MKPCCPTCGRAFPAPKRVAMPTDTATLTDAQLFAHYKQIAPRQDLSFFLANAGEISPELRARAESLTSPTAKEITRLRNAWRSERSAYERTHGIPLIGSIAWREALEAEDQRTSTQELAS